ncbi:MAG: DUF6705 family protein [Thermonemataceae bacterium]|nr:DUF6705 family protein [Thermonemataceae bacterium]
MKKILTFALLFFAFSPIAEAQRTISLSSYKVEDLKGGNYYLKDTEGILNPFVGTWRWQEGNKEFIIKLQKKEKFNWGGLTDYYKDIIMGGYLYKENGVEITNTLNFTSSLDMNNTATFQNFSKITGNRVTSGELNLIFYDIAKYNKECRAKLSLQNSGNSILIRLYDVETYRFSNRRPPKQKGFSVPNNVILNKQ